MNLAAGLGDSELLPRHPEVVDLEPLGRDPVEHVASPALGVRVSGLGYQISGIRFRVSGIRGDSRSSM